MAARTPKSASRGRVIGVVVAVLVVVAMFWQTKFVSPEEAAAARPQAFDPKAFAVEEFPKKQEKMAEEAIDVATFIPAYAQDPAAAGDEYGTNVSGKFTFALKATGEVTEADANFLEIKVPGVPADATVRVAVGAPLNGTPVRDALGDMTFPDFDGQTAFQQVANELKLVMQSEVIEKANPASLKGKQVEVVGAYTPGGPPNSYLIQPTTIEATS